MRFAFCIVALALGATMQAKPEGEYGKEGDGRYFESNLDGLQGALEDISKAGEDLVTLKTKLERLVDDSSLIYKAESVLESSVDKDVYINAWKSDENCICSGKANRNGEGSKCSYYHDYGIPWYDRAMWCYAATDTCSDARDHADDYGQESGYGASRAACKDEITCTDTNNGATDEYGDGCWYYIPYPEDCGRYDDNDFVAASVCCACGGGQPV